MKINHNTREIEMTKKESKEAAKYGSETYEKLVNIKKDFSDYTIIIRESTRKNSCKGYSYDRMETYISTYGSDAQKEQFKAMRITSKDSMERGKAYKEIKEWFNETFPEASDFSAAMARITAKTAV